MTYLFHIFSYVTARGHTRISRELYLPFDWCEDRERCQAAHIPEAVRFQTKPELAVQMIERIFQAHLPISWVVADTVYGGNLELRAWLEAHQYPYVLAVACSEPVGFQTPAGRRREEAALVESFVLHDEDWQRLSMSEGTKGPRLFDWAIVPMLHQWEDDGRHWLLIRRSLDFPAREAVLLCVCSVWNHPTGDGDSDWRKTGISRKMRANAKDLGLDHYEVRSFIGWYRHITLVLLALAYLAGICATERYFTVPPATSEPFTTSAVLDLTVPEVRHLLARLIWPASSSARWVLECRVVASLAPTPCQLLPDETSS